MLNTFSFSVKTKKAILEDIEQELGIELSVLFKAKKNGVWCIDSNGQIRPCTLLSFEFYFNEDYGMALKLAETSGGMMTTIEHNVDIYDYGETWALTKEELEK